jgi:hypothetical protein
MKNPTFTKRELAMMVQAVQRYDDCIYNEVENAEYHINRKFKWAVDMSKGSAKDIETINLQNGHYYLCKSIR